MGEDDSDSVNRSEQYYRAVAGAIRSVVSLAKCAECRQWLESLAAKYDSFAALAESESRARTQRANARAFRSGQTRGYWSQ
jgi:hypothetical protein